MNGNETHRAFVAAGQKWITNTFGPGPKITKTGFSLSGLNDGVARYDYTGVNLRAFDHMQYAKWGRWPFAIISQPYSTKEIITNEMRKVQQEYPNLVALFIDEESWWNDECVPFVITPRVFSENLTWGKYRDNFTWGTYCVTRSDSTNRRGRT
jgi:hypothetical protein